MNDGPMPGRRSPQDLAEAQLRAIDSWTRAHRVVEKAQHAAISNRELRLDLNRRRDARQREQAALLARSDAMLRDSGDQLAAHLPVRAVLAHRSTWLRERVAQRLSEAGVRVVAVFDDGADAAGTLVAEQPDLVFVEDLLPTMAGLEVVRRARAFAPATVTGAQVADSTGIGAFVDAGAVAVFTRQVPPADIANALLRCLAEPEPAPV